MALLPILEVPDPRLRQISSPVEKVDDGVRALVADMFETMYAAPGIGLAATQVDVHKQIIVVDVSERRDSLVVLVNPEIVDASGESDIEEGCLSVPGIYELVARAERVKVRAFDQNGNAFTPSDVDILSGGTVTFSWNGVTHNVTWLTTPASVQNITDRSTGSVAVPLNQAGTYSFHCTIHPGMDGTITVH